jgi:transglutaminase-like putative cysteine protease
MTLTNVFRISLYSLVSLAGSMLAYGEEVFLPSGLTVPLAGFILFFSERQGRLRINALVGNLLGLAVLGAAGFEFFGERPDARLLACAHFLVYITWIVLLQTKGIRQYWWLSALSLLQVAVGSVLTAQTGTYGLFLLAYLPLALWTLSVFTLYQGAYDLGGLDHEGGVPAPAASLPATVPTGSGKFARAEGATQTVTDSLAVLHRHFAAEARSRVFHAIQQDSPGHWIGPRFVLGVVSLAAAGLGLGLVMFLFVPRVSFNNGMRFKTEASRGRALTGFSGEVRLGQIGQILENIDRVMQVKLFERVDGVNDLPITMEEFIAEYGLESPLFRGAVLYEYDQGRWRGAPAEGLRSQTMRSHPLERGMIRQEYVLELSGAEYLFAMRPIALARLYDPRGPISYAYDTAAFSGSVEGRDPVEYLVYSRRRTPEDQSAGRNQFGELPGRKTPSSASKIAYLQRPATGIEGVIALAHELTGPEKLAENDELSPERKKAQALIAHLRDSNEYSYSLSMEVENPERDPIEEFVIFRKRGHCEYFASALALMLRAVDIPSRLVTGFKGADFHESEGFYEVQQRHAHAWVEAFVDNEWIVLDPTPDSRDEVVRQIAANAGFWKNAKHSLSSLWSTYVVTLSFSRQQETLYQPLTGKVSTGWSSIRNILSQVAGGADVAKELLTSPERYFSRSSAALGLIVIVVLAAGRQLARRAFGKSSRQLSFRGGRGVLHRLYAWFVARLTGRQVDPARVVVAFYERFLTTMTAAGFTRRNDQTQREFARDVELALCDTLTAADLGGFPTQLADLFYRVRFGEGLLQPAEAIDVEGRLSRLAASLEGADGRSGPFGRARPA